MRRSLDLVFAMFLLLSGTSLASAQSQPWKFLVFGDTRGTGTSSQINTNILTELVRATTNEKPAFVLVPGDLAYAGNLSAFQGWSNIMSPVYQAGIRVYPVRGNHDDDSDPAAYKAFFGPSLPQNGPAAELGLTYAVSYSNVLVLAMDNYVTAHQVNTNWIKSVLNANTNLHIFAMAHEPAFQANHTDCLDDVPAVRNTFWNILSNAACRVYFCGHDHFYDHMRLDDHDADSANDVHQMIAGGGGAPLSSDTYPYSGINDWWAPTRILHDKTNGYVRVEIAGPVATLTYLHRTTANNFVAADVFSYSLAPTITSVYANGRLTLTWSGGGRLQAAPAPGGPWSTLANGVSPYAITSFGSQPAFYRVQLRPATF